jgi:hypothetical protein
VSTRIEVRRHHLSVSSSFLESCLGRLAHSHGLSTLPVNHPHPRLLLPLPSLLSPPSALPPFPFRRRTQARVNFPLRGPSEAVPAPLPRALLPILRWQRPLVNPSRRALPPLLHRSANRSDAVFGASLQITSSLPVEIQGVAVVAVDPATSNMHVSFRPSSLRSPPLLPSGPLLNPRFSSLPGPPWTTSDPAPTMLPKPRCFATSASQEITPMLSVASLFWWLRLLVG